MASFPSRVPFSAQTACTVALDVSSWEPKSPSDVRYIDFCLNLMSVTQLRLTVATLDRHLCRRSAPSPRIIPHFPFSSCRAVWWRARYRSLGGLLRPLLCVHRGSTLSGSPHCQHLPRGEGRCVTEALMTLSMCFVLHAKFARQAQPLASYPAHSGRLN